MSQWTFSPCIMCVQYRGGAQYRGGNHEYRGGNHEYRGGYHEYRGGYLEYRGGVQYIMINVGDILSTMGCSVPWRIS